MASPLHLQARLRRRLFWYPLAAILIFWSVLYLPHLRTSPPWYGDETLTLMIGKSLCHGEGFDRSLKATFWHPSYAYQPGYALLAGAAAMTFGGDIVGARLFNACLALGIALVICFAGRRTLGYLPACFGALLFLSYEQSVIHFRWIYPHNAVALGFVTAVIFLMRKSRPKADWLAGAGLALAAFSHPLFVHGALSAWICRLKRPFSWPRLAIPSAIILVISTSLIVIRYWPHHWVWDDIQTLAGFYRTFSDQNGSGFQAFTNIRIFFTNDAFHLGAFLCAFLCFRKRLLPISIFLIIVAGLLLQNRQNLTVFYYQAVVFLPILVLAWAGALRTVSLWIRKWSGGRKRTVRLVEYVSLLIPLALFIAMAPGSLTGTLHPRNFPWVTQNTDEVDQAAAWVNQQVSTDDLVICHQNIGWLLKCRTADLMQATAWNGLPTFTFEKPMEKDRFAYSADVDRARFVIIGDIDQRWTFTQPNVDKIGEKLVKERWPLVWRGPNYLILANPKSAAPTTQP